MRTDARFLKTSPKKYAESPDWQKYIDRCRAAVGYKEDADWECPVLFESDFFARLEKETGFRGSCMDCFPCMQLEAHRWASLGLPIPQTAGGVGDAVTVRLLPVES